MELPRDVLIWWMFAMNWLVTTDTQVTFEGSGMYCQLEKFNATCGEDEIIVMLSARYGRMHPGRCITRNYGNLGCSADVLPYLDKVCSGRQSCEIPIPDNNLHKSRPCPRDFTSYLEASYECIRVSYGAHDCGNGDAGPLVAGEGFILGAIPTRPDDPSTLDCPWTISALPGQRINLTLINFAREPWGTDAVPGLGHGHCVDVAVVTEGATSKQETLQLCPHQNRERLAYLSKGNDVSLYTFPRDAASSDTTTSNVFLWRYRAEGCPDLDVTPGMWVRRTDDQVVVRCNITEETWYLICQEGTWKGRLGNCTQRESRTLTSKEDTPQRQATLPYGILITVAIGVALGIFLGGVLLIVVLVSRRYRTPTKRKTPEDYEARDALRPKSEADISGYGPVLSDECTHFPVLIDRFPHSSVPPGPTDIDMIPEEHYQKEFAYGHIEPPVLCEHHECRLYDTTRLKPGPNMAH